MNKSFTISPEDRTIIRGEEGEEKTPPRAPKRPPYLVLIEGPHVGSYFPLSEGKNTIGRSLGCPVRLEDHSVSRHHADLEKTETGWIVRDLGSKNGTHVNGKLISDAVVIGHKDLIKVGIYLLRLVTQEIGMEEELELPPEAAVSEKTIISETRLPPEAMTHEMPKEEVPPVEAVEEEEFAAEGARPLKERIKKIVFAVSAAVFIIGAVGYLASKYFLHPAGPKIVQKLPPVEPPITPPGEVGAIPPAVPPPPAAQKIPVFLDFASSPLPATVYFEEKELGKTPLRANVELEVGRQFTAVGQFYLPELNETYKLPVNFTVEEGQSVVPILFRGPIGMIKVNNLPRDVQFYLEGSFEYDRFKERPAKLNEIVLQKPIYIPYGKYQIELRKARQLGESQTFVPDLVFRREFTITADSPSYVLDLKEDDLKVFPVNIRSEPPNADVFIDGKMMGKTPYEGLFPLGDHTLTLRKEGYFEHTEALRVDINTPFTAAIRLETSVAGAHINNAIAQINRELYQQAVGELAQALASNPAPSEIAQANYLLGRCYLSLGDISKAISYFELSKGSEEWRYQSMLGQAAGYGAIQRMDAALPLLVEVLLKAKDENIKREANSLFQQISPFRSIIYVYSDPQGARITVNDKPVEQTTPAILHDLPLGSYTLKLEKPGYQPLELKLTLSVNEFNPVIVKLKPVVE
jgi:pSer/pThr/pTyr-binding forkhead associated (FHA) protein/tetratricopeptide (TPR) repeat protein